MAAAQFMEPGGQGWVQVGQLGLAFLFSSLIGLEREWKQKDAGLRTYTVVGIGAALFMLISKYGFGDVVIKGQVVLDPSRVAAQIVSGLGFIGAGVIFVHRGSVKGLTTAAGIWLAAAIGAACAAGLPVLAALATGGYLLLSTLRPFTRWLEARTRRPLPQRSDHGDGRKDDEIDGNEVEDRDDE
jgi:putative Mg2+ transporter-C (MgtC) family protein